MSNSSYEKVRSFPTVEVRIYGHLPGRFDRQADIKQLQPDDQNDIGCIHPREESSELSENADGGVEINELSADDIASMDARCQTQDQVQRGFDQHETVSGNK